MVFDILLMIQTNMDNPPRNARIEKVQQRLPERQVPLGGNQHLHAAASRHRAAGIPPLLTQRQHHVGLYHVH